MKTPATFFGLTMAALLVFAACDENKEEQAVYRSVPITLTFGTDKTATVEGTMLEYQWNPVPASIETKINAVYTTANSTPSDADTLEALGVFDGDDVVITAEKNPGP
jgi:hypothetical protein